MRERTVACTEILAFIHVHKQGSYSDQFCHTLCSTQSPGDIAPGITGDLTGYVVTFNPDVGAPEEETVDLTACRAPGICQYVLLVKCSLSSYPSVTAAGVNAAGAGTARKCNTHSISKCFVLLPHYCKDGL